MSNVILLDKELNVLRVVRRDGIKWLPAKDHGVFARGFDTWIGRHSDEAKRQLAREFMKMPLPTAKDTINRLLVIFKDWEAEKGDDNGEVGLPIDSGSSERECDPALPSLGTSGEQSGVSYGGPAS